jgi:hypothetical protein
MSEDDLEPRVRTVLAARAERIDSALSGPELRARAGAVKRPVMRFAAPALAVAAVIVVAVATQTVGHDGSHPRPAPPGRPVITTTSPTSPTPVVSPSPTTPPSPSTPVRSHRPTPTRTTTRVPAPPSTSLSPPSVGSPSTAPTRSPSVAAITPP